MTEDQSNIPDYHTPEPPQKKRYGAALALGICIGGALSVAVWIPFWRASNPSPIFLAVVPILKVLAAIALIAASRRLRFVGIGLLLSIPLGALIFFGACMGNLKF